MEHIQIIIYIVVGVIYLFSRLLKSRTETTADGKPVPKNNAPSLEEMFKEIGKAVKDAQQAEKGKKAEQTPRRPSQRQPVAQTPPKPVEKSPAKTGTEWVPFYERQEQHTPSYEQAPTADQLVSQFEKTPVYTNEASEVDYEDPAKAQYAGLDDHKRRFAAFDKRKAGKSALAQLLQNPQSARQAFVLSEIFRRKYE